VRDIAGLDPAVAVFENMAFNEGGIEEPGLSPERHEYTLSGWRISYEALRLDRNGAGGQGDLRLPENLGGLSIEFAESLLRPDGTFISGKAGPEHQTLKIQGIPVRLEEAELRRAEGRYLLSGGAPLVSLGGNRGELRFGRTEFESGGTVVSGDPGKERLLFVSANGYRVDTASYVIGKDGIRLTGTLGAAWWDDDVAVPVSEICLSSDLAISAYEKEGQALYRFAAWPIRGTGIHFEKDRIRIDSNEISYRGVEIELGAVQYDIQGTLSQA
jgi:hypothetical protein